MNSLEVFLLQLMMSLFVYTLFAKWALAPWLNTQKHKIALMILIAPHATRHVGLSFLVPSITNPDLPESFALAAAYGDFISAILAIIALFALRHSWKVAPAIVWTFSIVGLVDLINALRQADVVPLLEGTWYIPTFWVPLLLVTHLMIIARLLARKI